MSHPPSDHHSAPVFRLPASAIQLRLGLLKWRVPLGLSGIVLLYELGPAQWIYWSLGHAYFIAAEVLVFGTIGPLLAYAGLELLERWLKQKEISQLQTQALAQAHEQMRLSYQLSDDAVQTLFAASLLLASLRAHLSEPDVAEQLEQAGEALDHAIRNVRARLLNQAPPR